MESSVDGVWTALDLYMRPGHSAVKSVNKQAGFNVNNGTTVNLVGGVAETREHGNVGYTMTTKERGLAYSDKHENVVLIAFRVPLTLALHTSDF